MRTAMLRVLLCAPLLVLVSAAPAIRAGAAPAADFPPGPPGGPQIPKRGLCCLIGGPETAPTIGTARFLLADTDLLVHVLVPTDAAVAAVRQAVEGPGVRRVVVERWSAPALPYADNLIDLLLADANAGKRIRKKELLRVIHPGGVAMVRDAPGPGWKPLRKPVPDGIDDWSHWQHGPDNNPMSKDTEIKAPYMTQFLALPWFSTMPSISVIAGGRMFRAAGHMAIHQREEQYLNTLYATDACNGTLLWTRPIPANFLAHRSLFIAAADRLYLIEPQHCLVLDPETGAEKDKIVVPADVAPEGRWKWIALDGGVLYALIGGKDYDAEVIKRKRPTGAWGWNQLSKGYYEKKYPWGYGGTIVAIDAATKKVLWSHRSETPVDSRAMCMGHGRVFLHSEGHYVAALNATSGKEIWKANEPKLLKAVSEPFSQGLGFKTTPYTICTQKALYLGGRGRKNVVGVSATDGKLLFVRTGAYNATNLLYTGGYLYAHIRSATMLSPLTGETVKDIGTAKRSCARFTGCPDSLFHRGSIRGGEGTTRYRRALEQPTVIHAFRPPCNDGIIPAGGLLHITQWCCDCNLQLMGGIALCPAGSFPFNRRAADAERLETVAAPASYPELPTSPQDWTTYRADGPRSSTTSVQVAGSVSKQWVFEPRAGFTASPPTAAGGLVFLGGDDGIVRAIDARSGQTKWRFHTAGPVRIPPTIGQHRVYVGSADGYVYCLTASTGHLVWRFRAAPVERRIMVFGRLCSTWPVHTGVLLHDGVAYAAAGLINYDGTHVYALDALSGKIKWQNNTSGHLNPQLREGVSAQGDMAICGDRLLLAGGNVTSPGVYALADGKCLNAPPGPGWPGAHSGSMVCGFLGKYPMIGGGRLFTDPADPISTWKPFDVHDPKQVGAKLATGLLGRVAPAFGHGAVAASDRQALACYDVEKVEAWIHAPKPKKRGQPYPKLQPRWRTGALRDGVAVVLAPNAVLAAGRDGGSGNWAIEAFDLATGKPLWAQPLPAAPVANGLCVDGAGRIIAVLEGGRVVAFAAK